MQVYCNPAVDYEVGKALLAWYCRRFAPLKVEETEIKDEEPEQETKIGVEHPIEHDEGSGDDDEGLRKKKAQGGCNNKT